jgi:hypothetical protein
MTRSFLLASLMFLASLGCAHAGDNCNLGLETTTGNLLGQAGVKVSQSQMASPSLDCEHNGFFYQNFDYFATAGAWRYETDNLVGWRGQSSGWDYGVRAGEYHVDPGKSSLDFADQRGWIGYAFPLSSSLTLHPYFVVDNQYSFHGVGFTDKDTFGLAEGLTISWMMRKGVVLSLTGESWSFPNAGFFATGKPNFKVVPALAVDLTKNLTWITSYTGMWGDQFTPSDHTWKNVLGSGLHYKFQ